MRLPPLLFATLLLVGCGRDASMQHTNAQTTAELNAIADNTSEDAGNGEAGQGDMQAMGDTFRSGARAPVH
jgi:hypothetical protein